MMRTVSLITAIPCLLLAGCFGPAPGHGAKANVGFHASERVVVALDQFHRERGHYPARAEELVPSILPSLAAFSYTYHGDQHPLSYRRETDGSFSLSFSFVAGFPSYMNACSYTSKTRKWICSGYY